MPLPQDRAIVPQTQMPQYYSNTNSSDYSRGGIERTHIFSESSLENDTSSEGYYSIIQLFNND